MCVSLVLPLNFRTRMADEFSTFFLPGGIADDDDGSVGGDLGAGPAGRGGAGPALGLSQTLDGRSSGG